MKGFRSTLVTAVAISALSTSAQAVIITVDSQLDLVNTAFGDTSPNTSFTAPGALPGLPGTFTAGNGTPGVCTLREAILNANGDVAVVRLASPAGSQRDCTNSAYCPFSGPSGNTRIPNECVQGAAAGQLDEIVFASNTRGVILLDYTLPTITDAVTITGLGPDQTTLTGYAPYLAAMSPPTSVPGFAHTTTAGAAGVPNPNPEPNNTVDLPMFTISPDLPSGAVVTIKDLQVRGLRTHYFRTTNPLDANAVPAVCDGTAGGALPDCTAVVPGCNAAVNDGIIDCSPPPTEPNKRIVNFGGIAMDNGVSVDRKRLALINTRFNCNRRFNGADQGGAPFSALFTAPIRLPPPIRRFNPTAGFILGNEAFLPVSFRPLNPSGSAVSVQGKAAVSFSTATFATNVADAGEGGAVFLGAKDNASPSLTSGGDSVFDNNSGGCLDAIVVTDSIDTDATTSDNNNTSTAGVQLRNQPIQCFNAAQASYCAIAGSPLAYTPYVTGNIAGTSATATAAANAIPAVPAAGVLGFDGGSISVNALASTSVIGIGFVDIKDTQFTFSSAAGRGGAVALKNVARTEPNLPSFVFDNVLFGGAAGTGNLALFDGGGLFIQGHTNTPAVTRFNSTSFGNNSASGAAPANGKGGALYYVTRPGAPIDFNLVNVRFGNNAGAQGGAIFAEDNGVDDSGILSIIKATFSANTATAQGGAIFCGATKATSELTNVTLSGNVATNGGGIFVGNRCHLDLNNTTVTANRANALIPPAQVAVTDPVPGQGSTGGGGIFVPSSSANAKVDVRNTIVAANFSVAQNPTATTPALFNSENAMGPDCSALNNAVMRTANFNFVGTTTGCGPAGSPNRPFLSERDPITGECIRNATGDRVGDTTVALSCTPPLNPLLRILQDNGGPNILGAHNFTHLPDTGSLVVDNGDRTGCKDGKGAIIAQDEREAARPATINGVVTRCDIGAVEGGAQPPGNLTASTSCLPGTTDVHQLTTGTTTKEMLRFTVNAPANAGVTIRGLRIQAANPVGGVAGNYSSVNRIIVDQVNSDGSKTLLLDTPRPANFVLGATVEFALTTQLPIPASASRTIAVSYQYGPSSQLAMMEKATLIAGGFALLPVLGLIAVGRRRWALVVLAITAAMVTSCGGDSNDEEIVQTTPTSPNDRTFRTGVTAVFLQGNENAISVGNILCGTVTVRPIPTP